MKEAFQKILTQIYVRDIHNDMIKTFDNGELVSVADSMTRTVLISDTTLGSFIPPQVRKMTLNYVIFAEVRFVSFLRM